MANPKVLQKTIDEIPGLNNGMSAEEIISGWEKYKDHLKVTTSPQRTLQIMMETVNTLFEKLRNFDKIVVFTAPRGSSFITTDVPVLTYNSHEKAHYGGITMLGFRDSVYSIALSPTRMLSLFSMGPPFRVDATHKENTRIHNLYNADRSYGYVFSSNRDLLESIVRKTKLKEKDPPLMMEVLGEQPRRSKSP